jgi:hypothetical protein
MIQTLRDIRWFAAKSWPYLGCDHGTGRWRARRRYVARFVPAARHFLAACRRDRADVAGDGYTP